MGYTPGTWVSGYGKGVTGPTTPTFSGPFCAGRNYPYTVVSKDKEVIAVIPKQCDGVLEANAHLIAAAPELLEALKAIRPYIEDDLKAVHADREYIKVINMVIEAIAKAEGKQAGW